MAFKKYQKVEKVEAVKASEIDAPAKGKKPKLSSVKKRA